MRRASTAHVSLAAAAVMAAVAACSEAATGPSEEVVPITELPRALSVSEQAVIGASNTFAIDLLRQVHEAAPESTVFLSPLSASMALGMTMNGAAGATRSQMEEMLGFAGLTPLEINESYEGLIELLRGLDPRVDFRLANAIFHRESFLMEQPFLDIVSSYFDAHVEGLDFDDPAAADRMNAWVRSATDDRIDEIVEPPIDPLTMAFLMNAVYFKGSWTAYFDAGDTYRGEFHTGAESSPVRLMTKQDSLPYRSTDAWSAVELPYGGGAWVMTVAVPRDGHDLEAVLADLETLLDPATTWTGTNVEIHLPRFELEWKRRLNDDLEALGMVDAFDPNLADFTLMNAGAKDWGLHVGFVEQKTFLRVDEEGTEAAAVTVVGMVLECDCGPPRVIADRPFFLAIRERLSGTVAFAGLIVEAPEE